MLIWNGVDITSRVNIAGCVHTDSAGEKDVLELTLEGADQWYRWAPETGDRIEYRMDGYSTGEMYLDAVVPMKDRYRVMAGSVKHDADRKNYESFRGMTLGALMTRVAASCRMNGALYGLGANLDYTYLMKRNEGYAAFMERILRMEGGTLKVYNGTLRGIGILYAQERPAVCGLTVTTRQAGIVYRRRESQKWNVLKVVTPYASAKAIDMNAVNGTEMVIPNLPAMTDAQAGRWARGLILSHNRKCETLTVEQELNLRMTALARVDVTGGTDADGLWIVDKAEHDLYNRRTEVTMVRAITTVI